MKPETSDVHVYSGTSMYPTLLESDLVEIEPIGGGAIRVGDILLFHAPNHPTPIVHRVEQIRPEGIRTRGDNSRRMDEWRLDPGQVIGRVVAVFRGGRRRAAWNGRKGRFRARLLFYLLPVGQAVNRILHFPYHALSARGVFSRWMPSGWRPRKVLFVAGGRRFWRMQWGRHVVGQYDDGSNQWRIRRPFRLLIDPRELEIKP
jgi:hypothetical protein